MGSLRTVDTPVRIAPVIVRLFRCLRAWMDEVETSTAPLAFCVSYPILVLW